MGETTHTPGPWSVQKGINCLHVVSDDNTFHTGCITFNGSAAAHANARLIAAAPDLLAACESVRNECRDLYASGRMSAETWFAVKAAIEKARGESA